MCELEMLQQNKNLKKDAGFTQLNLVVFLFLLLLLVNSAPSLFPTSTTPTKNVGEKGSFCVRICSSCRPPTRWLLWLITPPQSISLDSYIERIHANDRMQRHDAPLVATSVTAHLGYHQH